VGRSPTDRTDNRARLCALVAACALALFSGCSSSPNIEEATAEDLYDIGVGAMENGDYTLAIGAFSRLTAESPLHEHADDALLALADSYRATRDFASAEAEYRRLVRDYPRSPLVPEAEYKLGLAFMEQSPDIPLDQDMTNQAILQFERFLRYYPGSGLVVEAEARILELRSKLAEKRFRSAELYFKMGDYEASRIYLESVVSEFPDTPWAPKALLAEGEGLLYQGETARAEEVFERLIRLYPDSEAAATAAAIAAARQ
jgi:outer membrane protein assembly factor BamD